MAFTKAGIEKFEVGATGATPAELRTRVRAKLETAEGRLFDTIVKRYPNKLSQEALASANAYDTRGAAFRGAVRSLVRKEIACRHETREGVDFVMDSVLAD